MTDKPVITAEIPEWVRALPRPGRGPCAGYVGENRPHDRHFLQSLPGYWTRYPKGYRDGSSEQSKAQRAKWSEVGDGFVCTMCWAVWDPVPTCQQNARYDSIYQFHGLCGAKATSRENGVNYCGVHSPSRSAAREARKAAREAEKRAAREATYQTGRELDRAEQEFEDALAAWYRDEAATEGFCYEPCEHHECRLARAIEDLRSAEQARQQAREQYREVARPGRR